MEPLNLIRKDANPYTGVSYGGPEERGYPAEQDGVVYLRFPQFDRFSFLRHGYSTRIGGVSTGVCAAMSFSEKCGDTPEQITENFRRISAAIGVDSGRLVLTDQIHEAKVLPVTGADICDEKGKTVLSGVDGIVTDVPGLTLVCFTADCVPLFFVDPVHRAIGAAHAGWRGTVKEIGRNTVRKMEECFGSRPEELHAVIGPSICAGCYEVSGEVAEAFEPLCSGPVRERFLTVKEQGRYRLDLWQANKELLQLAGIPEKQIAISGICTCCNSEILFSHRATAGKRGLLTGYLSLAPDGAEKGESD